MIPLHAGGDWSGDPNKLDEAFIFCVVALGDKEAWSDSCRQLRRKLRMPQNREFHGHEMKNPQQRLELLEMGRAAEMKVGALIVAKETRVLMTETLGYQDIALELLNQFFPRYILRDLWCDNEIQGDKQKAFETELKRCHRAINPQTRFDAKVRPSHTNDLIQLADGIAYALQAQARGTLKNLVLRQFLKDMAADEGNLLVWR